MPMESMQYAHNIARSHVKRPAAAGLCREGLRRTRTEYGV